MKKCLLLLTCLLFLTGCSHTYLERQVYPICLSIDMDEEGRYEVALQAPKTSENATSFLRSAHDFPPPRAARRENDEMSGDALRVLAASTPYPLNFSQIRLCLIEYRLAATTPLRPLLRTLFELPGMRPNAQVMIAQGKAQDVMQSQKPDFGQRLSTHLTILFERLEREQTMPESTLADCVRELGDGRSDFLIALCAVHDSLKPQPSAQPAFAVGEPWSDQLLPENEIAGLLSRTGPNPVEYIGSAAVSDGRVSGMLTGQETQLAVRVLNEADRYVASSGNTMQLQVKIKRGTALEGQETSILALVRKLQSLHSDALLFGCEASRAFYTDADWQALGFRERYPSADAVVWAE